ncbi:hypothetical protein [Candidatus Liberibacter sp.]|uniref:hypothetical protein n=1 Tax=Candidatus Liberibacter sp. TaxID=34022 RepID=UPI001C71692C|nr:hypothetical protein [Candidatus Liberibacter sp.]
MNHFGENDEFWQKINQHNSLIRLPSQKTSQCHMTKHRNQEPIDFFIMNVAARELLSQGSFSEILYHQKEAVKYGYRLSDHCPIAVNYNF